MAIKILDRAYGNNYDTQDRDWILGNVGSWQTAKIQFEAIAQFYSSEDGQVMTDNGVNTLTLGNGKEWWEYALFVDGSFKVQIECLKTTAGATTVIFDEVGAISLIDGGFMVTNIALATLPYNSFPAYQVESNIQVIYHLKLTYWTDATKTTPIPFDQVKIGYNLVPNSTIEAGNLLSIIDSTPFEATILGIGAMAIDEIQDMTLLNFISGMAVKSMTLKKLTTFSFEIEIEYMVHGFFESANNYMNGTVPTYFNSEENLGDNFVIEAFAESNNPNIYVAPLSVANIQGNTGWINENYNGLPNEFVINDLILLNELGQYQEAMAYNANTKFKFSISKEDISSWSEVKLQIGFMRMPRLINEISNKETSFLDNCFVSCKAKGDFDNGYFKEGVFNLGYFDGWGLDGGMVQITNVLMNVVNGDLDVEFILNPNTIFKNFIESKGDNDRAYLVWISVASDTSDLEVSDRVSLDLNKSQLISGVSYSGEYPYLNVKMVEHPYSSGQNDQLTSWGLPHDDITAQINIWKDETQDIEFTEVSYGIEAEKMNGERFTLESSDLNLSQSIIDSNDIQQIETISSRGFKLASDNEKNIVSLQRDSTIDQPQLTGYKGLYGWKNRYEDWIPLSNVSDDFYDIALPNIGYNHDWSRYSQHNDWDVYFVVYITAIIDGVEVNYRNTLKFKIGSFFDNSDIDVLYKFRNASTGTALTAGVDTETGKQLGVILSDVNTEFEIQYLKQSGIWTQEIVDLLYATATIEVDNGAGELSMRQISSVITQENGSPMLPVGGTFLQMVIDVDPTILKVIFQINPINLDIGSKYRFTGRLGCLADLGTGQYNSQYNSQYD